jgi:hypothetical protein
MCEATGARGLALALEGYAALGARPASDWARAGLSVDELGDFQFNWACAHALRGDEGAAQQILAGLVAEGRLASESELVADDDLRAYAERPWMHELRLRLRSGRPAAT